LKNKNKAVLSATREKGAAMNNKKYNLRLTQEEMDNIVYALVLLKVDAMNCLESRIGDQEDNSKQLAMACSLLKQCAEEEGRC
jgi:hypothetical protein